MDRHAHLALLDHGVNLDVAKGVGVNAKMHLQRSGIGGQMPRRRNDLCIARRRDRRGVKHLVCRWKLGGPARLLGHRGRASAPGWRWQDNRRVVGGIVRLPRSRGDCGRSCRSNSRRRRGAVLRTPGKRFRVRRVNTRSSRFACRCCRRGRPAGLRNTQSWVRRRTLLLPTCRQGRAVGPSIAHAERLG